MIKFALAGNPNSGKTTLFNSLTGSTAHVGNWPGVTVDKREGLYKKFSENISIVDLPGIYSLSPYTPEEVIARNYLIEEKPDCVINIIDATNLERNLYLTTQILEMDRPLVVALNMIDAVTKSGDKIDDRELEKRLGVPVVKVSALRGEGLDELMKRAYEVCKKPRTGKTVLQGGELSHLIGDVKIALAGQGVENPLFHAIKLVEKDEIEIKDHPAALKTVEEFKATFTHDVFGQDIDALIADARYTYITNNYSPVLTKKITDISKETPSDKADRIITNRWAGIPIFLLILFSVFHLTFSENFLYLGSIIKPFGEWCATQSESSVGAVFFTEGINSPGVILFNALDLLTATLGDLAKQGLLALGAQEGGWVVGLVCDGVLGGLFAVLSFLPQILVLFLLFSILEDSGYMARAAFMLDKIFRKFGVSGRAFMPMIMGFGCSVPAMINTRTLADEKERTATLRVIPFFSCGAKLPILTAISGGIVSAFGVGNADLITYSMYLLGIVTAVVSLLIMRSTTMRGEVPPFIMELPAYHAPQFKNLMLHLWDKMKHFIEKAFTIILASTIVIWFLSNFGWNWKYLDGNMHQSILASIGQLIQPLFTPLGFGSQLTAFGWVFAVAAITGLIAKENVVATFFALASCIVALVGNGALVGLNPELAAEVLELIAAGEGSEEGVLEAVAMISVTGITVPALLSFIAFNMTTIPCFATVATAKAELLKGKFKWTLLFWIVVSYVVSTMVYLVGSWPWTIAIFALVAVLAVVGIKLYNKRRDLKRA